LETVDSTVTDGVTQRQAQANGQMRRNVPSTWWPWAMERLSIEDISLQQHGPYTL